MLQFSISRSWKHLIQVNQELAQFLELNQISKADHTPTLIQLRVEITTTQMTASRMVLPVKDFNQIMSVALGVVESSPYSSLDELILKLQTHIQVAFKSYCVGVARSDLQMLGFELELENGLKVNAKNNDLEVQDNYRLNVIHDLATDESYVHGHDMKVGVVMSFKNWTTHPTFTSVQTLSRELKNKARELLTQPYHKSKLNRYFISPTGEHLADHFFKIFEKTKLGPFLKEVRIFETQKNQYSAKEM